MTREELEKALRDLHGAGHQQADAEWRQHDQTAAKHDAYAQRLTARILAAFADVERKTIERAVEICGRRLRHAEGGEVLIVRDIIDELEVEEKGGMTRDDLLHDLNILMSGTQTGNEEYAHAACSRILAAFAKREVVG